VVLSALAIAFLLFVGLAPPASGAAPPDPDHVAAPAMRAAPQAARAAPERPAAVEGALAHDEIGGDDVAVLRGVELQPGDAHPLAAASDGTLYAVAWVRIDASTSQLRVYRSQDHGHAWSLWGVIGGAANVRCEQPVVRVAEGDVDRVYVAYRYRSDVGSPEIRVAWSSFTASASWTEVVALAQAGVNFAWPSLDADDASYAGYALYLAAEAEDGDGDDIWFTRSADFGASWAAGYRIAAMSVATRGYRAPEVRYGFGGVVHCVWVFSDDTDVLDEAIRYRRALNRAAGGAADWQPTVMLTPNDDGHDEIWPTVAASTVNNWMLVAWGNRTPQAVLSGTGLWGNVTAGATWDPAFVDSLRWTYYFGVRKQSGLGDFVAAASAGGGRYGILRAPGNAPTSWGAFQELSDRSYADGYVSPLSRCLALDPSMGERAALLWDRVDAGLGADTLFFDAEWRRDPGWPNLEPGFPLALPAGVISPPAICELDGDPESEIVFGDSLGYVRAYDHDGTVVPGWPRSAGAIAEDSPVAVGDLDGDGRNEVVVGSATGVVHAWRHDGTVLPGWPVTAGAAAAYVSLGPLLPSSPLQVVVACGTQLRVLLPSGATAPGWPTSRVAAFTAPAAIGDVDDDGTFEIVCLFGGYMNVVAPNGTVEHFRNVVAAGMTFPNAPTLADLDLDGDLEIAAPTAQGRLYVLHHDGTDMTGWPWNAPESQPLTSVALANLRAGHEAELMFASETTNPPQVWCMYHEGGVYSGWPRTTGVGWWVRGMPVVDLVDDPIEQTPYITFVGSRDGQGHAWDSFGGTLAGWSLPLGGKCQVSPATGDVDHDGNLEIVFTTFDPGWLVVADLGSPVWRNVSNLPSWWPMYGYNPERMGCLECAPYAVTGTPGPAGAPARLALEPPRPNPTRGPLALRFALPARAAVRLDVLDVAGRRVRELLRSELDPGVHDAAWDGRDRSGGRAPAGVYFVRLAVPGAPPQVRRVALTQ
jgi:hypothetical protein